MSRDDDTIPCPERLNRDSWATLILDLRIACGKDAKNVPMTSNEATHILTALRCYAEHGGEMSEPTAKPWRNRYRRPEGCSQAKWDNYILGYETLAFSGDQIAKHALASFPRVPDEWPIASSVETGIGKRIEISVNDPKNPYVKIVVYGIGTTAFPTDNARAVASTINEVMDEYEGRRE